MLSQYISTMRFLINNPKYVGIITKWVKTRRRLLELPGRLRKKIASLYCNAALKITKR